MPPASLPGTATATPPAPRLAKSSGLQRWACWFLLLAFLVPLTRISAADDPASTPLNETLDSRSDSVVTNGLASTLTTMEGLDDTHRMVAGDRISFRIVEDQEDAKVLIVKDSGQVEIPYIGLFSALNKTCKQLATELKRELEREYYYQATVIIALDQYSRSRGRVYLFGAVVGPGPKEIPSDDVFTVSKLVMSAGGFAEFADKKRVKVTRREPGGDSQKVFLVDVGEVLEKGRTEKDVELQPGDVVYVRERAFNL